jgi:hypothetical protein
MKPFKEFTDVADATMNKVEHMSLAVRAVEAGINIQSTLNRKFLRMLMTKHEWEFTDQDNLRLFNKGDRPFEIKDTLGNVLHVVPTAIGYQWRDIRNSHGRKTKLGNI